VKPHDISCPKCHAPPGSLVVTIDWWASPLGTWSLAGVQLKTPMRRRPHLTCTNLACDLDVWGEFDGDDRHVTFPREAI